MAKHAAIPDRQHRAVSWTAPVAWAVLTVLVGAVVFLVSSTGWRDVPDRAPVPLPPEVSTDSPTGLPTVPLDPSIEWQPEEPETVVVPVVEQVAVPERAPLQFETPPVYGEADYRSGRIMEPWPRDDLESQRRRAYARCIAGLENDARQVAYCDRWYGPESGYTPDR